MKPDVIQKHEGEIAVRLKGKTVLVAGAGRNNGRGISMRFAEEGADLIMVARKREDELQESVDECRKRGATVLPMLADLSKPSEANRVVQAAIDKFGKVDVNISAMGIRPHMDFWEYPDDLWTTVFSVNVHSTFYLAKALAPHMIARKSGSIVALGAGSSITATRRGGALEAACKHALFGLIKGIARDLGPHGIRANLLILAKMVNKRLNPEWYQEAGNEPNIGAEEGIPLGRLGTPEDVANAALFLASDESSYITGDRILCTGGKFNISV